MYHYVACTQNRHLNYNSTSPKFSDLSTAKQLWSMVVWHLLDEDVSSGYLRIGSFRDAGIGWAYHFARIVFTF